MKFFLLTIIFLIFFQNIAFSQWEVGFKYEYPRRYKVLDSLGDAVFYYIDSMKARQSYEDLRIIARKHNDKKALLIADKLEFYRRATFSESNEYCSYKADSIAPLLIKRSKELNFPAIEGSIYYGLGIYYFEKLEKYSLAFENFFLAFDILDKLSLKEFPEKGFYDFDYAMRCYRFGDYKNAITFASKAGQFPYRNVLTEIYNSDLLGMSYYKIGNYDSARYYFNKCYNRTYGFKADQSVYNDSSFVPIWKGIALGNYGNTWYMKNKYNKAIFFLNKGIQLTEKWEVWDNTCGFANNLANIYLIEKQLDSAFKYLAIAKKATRLGGDESDFYELYKSLSDYHKLVNEPTIALRDMDSAMWWHDSLNKRININKKTQAELTFAKIKHAHEEKVMQLDLQMQKLVRNNLIVLILIGSASTIFFVKSRQQKMKQKEELLEVKKRFVEQELNKAKEKIAVFSKDIQKKNKLIDSLENIQNRQKAISEEQSDLLERLRKSIILTDENWEEFRQNFEIVHPGYIYNIKVRFPECTPAEFRLIVLEKLHLNNKEMASMLGVSPETIRSTKSRLKKKLGDDYAQFIP